MKNLMVQAVTLHRLAAKLVAIVLFAVLLSAAPFHAALAAIAPALGTASTFAVLGGPAVTLTNSIVIGDVGSGSPSSTVTVTTSTIAGTVHEGDTDTVDTVAVQAYDDFLAAYNALPSQPYDQVIDGNLAGQVLTPGVYLVDAASTTTGGTLTLSGPSNGIWIFKIGTALTGTNFSVVMANGGSSCNVYWWVAEGATMTTSNFQGTILAGAAITITGGTFNGDALAKAGVTMTNATITGCNASGGGKSQSKCNQGVGNGTEGCDPGNSNQGDESRSNDENGGTPGDPGRKGGNK